MKPIPVFSEVLLIRTKYHFSDLTMVIPNTCESSKKGGSSPAVFHWPRSVFGGHREKRLRDHGAENIPSRPRRKGHRTQTSVSQGTDPYPKREIRKIIDSKVPSTGDLLVSGRVQGISLVKIRDRTKNDWIYKPIRPVDLVFRRVVLPLFTILGQLTPNTGKLCLGRMVGVKFQKIWLEHAKIWGNSSRCELPFWGGALSSATSFQQAAGSGSQRLFCAPTTSTGCHQRCPLSSGFWGLSVNQLGPLKKDCIEPLQAYQGKSTISVAAGFLLINNCMCLGVTKSPPNKVWIKVGSPHMNRKHWLMATMVCITLGQ